MEADEKAIEIINKIYSVIDKLGNYPMCIDTTKQCAVILIDEIISLKKLDKKYWIKIKNEIK